jgi:large subunit ribosomal protein L25
MQELQVRTTPRNIPDSITIDVSEMTLDTVIRVGDITLPAGVTAEADDDAAVVTVLVMRAAEIEEAEGGGEDATADADATEGDTPGDTEAGGDAGDASE